MPLKDEQKVLIEEQKKKYQALKDLLDKIEEDYENIEEDESSLISIWQANQEVLKDVKANLDILWEIKSDYMPQYSEILANASRSRK